MLRIRLSSSVCRDDDTQRDSSQIGAAVAVVEFDG